MGQILKSLSLRIHPGNPEVPLLLIIVNCRRAASDVTGFRRTSEPRALEVQERLRHSMQATGMPPGKPSGTGRGGGGSLAAEPRAVMTVSPSSVGRRHGEYVNPNATTAAAKQTTAPSGSTGGRQQPLATFTTAATSRFAPNNMPPGQQQQPMGAPSYRAAPAPCAPGGQQHRLTAGLVAAAGASGAAAPSSSLQPTALQRQQQRRAPAPSEAGTYADWWQRPGSSSSSVLSYPMTAVSLLASICLPLPRPLLKECL